MSPGGVRRGPARLEQLPLVHDDHVGHPKLAEVVGHAAADNASPDYDYARMVTHRPILRSLPTAALTPIATRLTRTETAPRDGLDPNAEEIGVVTTSYHHRRRPSMFCAR